MLKTPLVEIQSMIEAGRSFVPRGERIRLQGVHLHSPGAWDFIGALNPLEVIRKYLSDRHDRKKDLLYRSAAEQRKLELENLSLETRVIRERVALAREVGIPESEITFFVNELLDNPLERLGKYADEGVITGAQIVEQDNPYRD